MSGEPQRRARARAILADHAGGLHADHDDPDVGCRYPGCDDAFWLLAFAAGPGLHELAKLADLEGFQ